LVWEDSWVGHAPQAQEGFDNEAIGRLGFNSPFEEFSIAESLRKSGVRTVHPRAIYAQTASAGDAHVTDMGRFRSHAGIISPDGEPLLRTDHRYVTLWGYWTGVDYAELRERPNDNQFFDLMWAFKRGYLGDTEYRGLYDASSKRFESIGIDRDRISPERLICMFSADGKPMTDDRGKVEVTMVVDANTARSACALGDEEHRSLIERQRRRMFDAGFESLDLKGEHLLLSLTSDGTLVKEKNGEVLVTQCGFSLVKPIL
jgi:hypothetical protein